MSEQPASVEENGEGRVLLFVPPEHAQRALRGRKKHPEHHPLSTLVFTFLDWAEREQQISPAMREMFSVIRAQVESEAAKDQYAKALLAELIAFGLPFVSETRTDVERIINEAEREAIETENPVLTAVQEIKLEVMNAMDRAEEMHERRTGYG